MILIAICVDLFFIILACLFGLPLVLNSFFQAPFEGRKHFWMPGSWAELLKALKSNPGNNTEVSEL